MMEMYTSIHWQSLKEFKAYINRIVDQTISVSDALEMYRELRVMPEKFKQLTVKDLSNDPKLIDELYNVLKSGMQPETRFKLGCTTKFREQELIKNLAGRYDIDTVNAKAKVITSIYRDNEGRTISYAFECVIAPRKDLGNNHAGELRFIGNINDSPPSGDRMQYFAEGSYHWYDKQGKPKSATCVGGILYNCGFSQDSYMSRRRKPCVVLLNLRTPYADWVGSAGKTHINLTPYSDVIAKTVSSLAYKMPSYHGEGYAYYYESSGARDPDQIAEKYLIHFLKDRKRDVDANPDLKITDRLTQSGVWYRIRPVMVDNGFRPRKSWTKTRRTLTSNIDTFCKELFGLRREDLGIIAAAKGIMYYRGESYSISIDNIKELARKGIAIMVIEKEGIPDILAPHAAKYGIALVTTGGRFTNYVRDLIEEIKKIGSIVWTLVDFDAVGEDIARSTWTKTPKMGIDRSIVPWLQENGYPELTQEDVEEAYTPPKGIAIPDEYLKHHRIELDGIVAEVKGEGLWKYLLYRMQLPEFSPDGFDLNKVAIKPANEEFYTDKINDAISKLDMLKGKLLKPINEYLDDLLKTDKKRIEEELGHAKKLKPIADQNGEIRKRLGEIVTGDQNFGSKAEEVTSIIYNLLSRVEQWKSNDGKNYAPD
jgi:hypothetical protein